MASREVGDGFWLETYINSARRFRDIVEKAGADVALSNHTNDDSMEMKLAALAKRKPGGLIPMSWAKTASSGFSRSLRNARKQGCFA